MPLLRNNGSPSGLLGGGSTSGGTSTPRLISRPTLDIYGRDTSAPGYTPMPSPVPTPPQPAPIPQPAAAPSVPQPPTPTPTPTPNPATPVSATRLQSDGGATDLGRPIGTTTNQVTGQAAAGPRQVDPTTMADFQDAARNLTRDYIRQREGPEFQAAQARSTLDNEAEGQFWRDVGKGEEWANKNFAEGSMGRMVDPRAAETATYLNQLRSDSPSRTSEMRDFLSKLQAGTSGFSSEDMQVMREQGESEINRRAAENLQRLGGIAASHGVRGGAGAGLQQRALTQAMQEQGDLSRQLQIQNIAQRNLGIDRYGRTLAEQEGSELAQRNRSTERYGSALSAQQATELGISKENLGALRQELFGRTSTPFQIASALDASRSGARADELSRQQLDTAKQYVKQFGQTGGYGGSKVPNAPSEEKVDKTYRSGAVPLRDAKTGEPLSPDIAKSDPLTQWFASKGYSNWDDVTDADRESETFKKATQQSRDSGHTTAQPAGTILCTEACRQGLITEQERYIMSKHGLDTMSLSEFKAYWAWATPVVAKMRANKWLARSIAKVIRAMVKDLINGDDNSLKWRAFHAVNAIAIHYRSMRLKHGRATI